MTISETRERFLKAILATVPAKQVEEIHFFSPIRQGGVEGGVAVVAAVERAPESAAPVAPEAPVESPEIEEFPEPVETPEPDYTPDPIETPEPVEAPEPEESPLPDESPDPVLAEEVDEERAAPPKRVAVYTARYRYVLKGPDRGKWEAQVTAEADAPLLTVETVVRGVQRRSGDTEEPERMSGHDVRALADEWTARASA